MNAPTNTAYLIDQQSSAVAEICALLPKITDASAVQDILLAMVARLMAESCRLGDDEQICAEACSGAYQEIRDQLEGDVNDAAEVKRLADRERGEDMRRAG